MTNEKELRIIATVVIEPAYREELLEIFQTVVAATRKEAGNLSYGLYEQINDSDKYTFIEVWQSQDAIDSHNSSDHFQTFVKAIEGKVKSLTVDVLKAKF